MGALELLHCFMKVDDAVQEREDLCGKSGYISHGPVMRVEDGKDVVHPASVYKRPRHEGKERYLAKAMLSLRDID